MKIYIKSSTQTYYRLDHRGSRDKDEHFGTTSFNELTDKLAQFGLPRELANFDGANLPDYITVETLPTGVVINRYGCWELSKRG